jgi:hypothetical protein
MARSSLPVPLADAESGREVSGIIESVIADVPPPRTQPVPDAATAADTIARDAARAAAAVSGSLALPPGPLGMLTVLPDLYVLWKIQRQMVSDLFGLYGRTAELSRTHMLYCLFRHMASHVLRDVAVRAGQRLVVQSASAGVLRQLMRSVGVAMTQRVATTAASRWVPLAGAAAVGAYAYWDTLQVAKTARRLLDAGEIAESSPLRRER